MTYLATIVRQQHVKLVECYACSAPIALTDDHEQRARSTGMVFWCPHGHEQVYKTTELQRLREKLDEQTRQATAMAERARQAEAAEQTAQIEMKRLKRRAKAGVCPCCNRSFVALTKHMATKHPDFAA